MTDVCVGALHTALAIPHRLHVFRLSRSCSKANLELQEKEAWSSQPVNLTSVSNASCGAWKMDYLGPVYYAMYAYIASLLCLVTGQLTLRQRHPWHIQDHTAPMDPQLATLHAVLPLLILLFAVCCPSCGCATLRSLKLPYAPKLAAHYHAVCCVNESHHSKLALTFGALRAPPPRHSHTHQKSAVCRIARLMSGVCCLNGCCITPSWPCS